MNECSTATQQEGAAEGAQESPLYHHVLLKSLTKVLSPRLGHPTSDSGSSLRWAKDAIQLGCWPKTKGTGKEKSWITRAGGPVAETETVVSVYVSSLAVTYMWWIQNFTVLE